MNNGILVIEDNAEMQDLLKLLLEQEGYQIISAATGSEGLHVLRSNPELILILLDLTLPDITADEFLLKMKSEELGHEVPIVYFSAIPRLQQMKLPVGVVGVIQKPFQINEFLSTISLFRQKFSSQTINYKTTHQNENRVN